MTPVSASVCPCVPSERGEAAPCSLLSAPCSLLPLVPSLALGPWVRARVRAQVSRQPRGEALQQGRGRTVEVQVAGSWGGIPATAYTDVATTGHGAGSLPLLTLM